MSVESEITEAIFTTGKKSGNFLIHEGVTSQETGWICCKLCCGAEVDKSPHPQYVTQILTNFGSAPPQAKVDTFYGIKVSLPELQDYS